MDPDDNNDDGSPMQDDPNTHELGPTDAPEGEDPLPGLGDDDNNDDED
jgi:coiled-coil domain-containing protein 40